jgi:hypothetical protein
MQSSIEKRRRKRWWAKQKDNELRKRSPGRHLDCRGKEEGKMQTGAILYGNARLGVLVHFPLSWSVGGGKGVS